MYTKLQWKCPLSQEECQVIISTTVQLKIEVRCKHKMFSYDSMYMSLIWKTERKGPSPNTATLNPWLIWCTPKTDYAWEKIRVKTSQSQGRPQSFKLLWLISQDKGTALAVPHWHLFIYLFLPMVITLQTKRTLSSFYVNINLVDSWAGL